MQGDANSTSNATIIPGTWDTAAHAAWIQGDKNGAIQRLLRSLNAALGNEPTGHLAQFSYYLFLLGDYKAAMPALERVVALTPNDTEATLNLAVCCSLAGNAPRAVEIYTALAAAVPVEFRVWDGLAACQHTIGEDAAARVAGTKALQIKDALSKLTEPQWRLPAQTPQQQAAGKKKVIAFSLFGANPRYLRGALHNILRAKAVYPGWVCRFYIDSTVPAQFVATARAQGAEIVACPEHQSMMAKLSWRFAVANDPEVGYFLVRDADSVVNPREQQAVDAWLASGKYFHVIRDWWTHTELILAGMWAGVAGVLPALTELQAKYQSKVMETPSTDQIFLRDVVWPLVRQSVCIHDRCFTAFESQTLPGPLPAGNFHIGQDEYAGRRTQQAQFLLDRLGPLSYLKLDVIDVTNHAPVSL